MTTARDTRASRAYEDSLTEALGDPEETAAYLTAALEDGDPGVFLLALRDVAGIHGGVAEIARISSLNRESLYRMLSEEGNPTITSLSAVLKALGLRLTVAPARRRRSAA